MTPCTANTSGEDYADFIYRHNGLSMQELYEELENPCLDFVNSNYVIIHAPLDKVLPLSLERYPYSSIPKLYALLDTTSMEASGILAVSRQPKFQADGSGALIGLIDTGIDYQNPVFRKSDGSSRILGILDQTLGESFTQAQIDEALKSPDPLSIVPSTDTIGHGTFLAGIAAGGPNDAKDFIGTSPLAGIAMVKLKPAKQYLRDFFLIRPDAIAYQENDIMLGITYLVFLAAKYRMPLSILISLGHNQGSHNGLSPLSQVLNRLGFFRGVSVSCAAGNEVGFRKHYFQPMAREVKFDETELRVGSAERGFILELWARIPERYLVGFVSPTGEVIPKIPLIQGHETRITFSGEATVITVNYQFTPGENDSQLIFMRFEDPTPGIWRIRIYNTLFLNGKYHMWLPNHEFTSEDTFFLESNPDTTITDPGNAVFPITVSTYNHLAGSLYIHSSRGYTANRQIKPDLAAPGVEVYGPGIGASTPMIRMTGSSVAAAHVAGVAANMLAYSILTGNAASLNNQSIKSNLIQGAKRNPNYTYPNREWGYGTLDSYQSFLAMMP